MLAEGGVYVGGVVDAAVLVGAVAADGGGILVIDQ